MSDYLLLHQNGKPIIVSKDCVYMVLPKQKGKGSVLVTGLDLTPECDETAEEILDLLEEMEIELIEASNQA